MRHELLAQIEHGELAGVLHQVDLREFEDEGAHQDSQKHQADGGQAVPGRDRQVRIERCRDARGIGRQVTVYGDFGQQWAEDLEDGLKQQEDQRNRHVATVRSHVAQQPAHQFGIVCLTEDFLFH